jgi:hypothetical protein
MLLEQATPIRDMIARTGSQSLLDYGCGKGEAYQLKDIELIDGETAPSLQDYWKLEHITEPDLGWVIDELFSHARRFLFAIVACYPAKKHLPKGQNAYCPASPPAWWTGLIHGIAMRYKDVSYRFHLVTRTGPRKKLGDLYGKRALEEQLIDRWA